MSRTATIAALATGFLVLAMSGALWARHGTAVFFDTLAASFAGCFF